MIPKLLRREVYIFCIKVLPQHMNSVEKTHQLNFQDCLSSLQQLQKLPGMEFLTTNIVKSQAIAKFLFSITQNTFESNCLLMKVGTLNRWELLRNFRFVSAYKKIYLRYIPYTSYYIVPKKSIVVNKHDSWSRRISCDAQQVHTCTCWICSISCFV